MSVAIAPQLDYSAARKVVSSSGYRYSILYPQSQEPVLQNTSTTKCDFVIPAEVINLSRSYLTGTIALSNANIVDGNCYKMHNGFLALLQNIKLSVMGGGGDLVDIQNLPAFSKITMPACTSLVDFLTNPSPYIDDPTSAAKSLLSPTQFFNPARCVGRVSSTTVVDGALAAVAVNTTSIDQGRIFHKGAFYLSVDAGTAAVESTNPMTCVSQAIGSSNATIGTASAFYVSFQIPLSQIKESLLCVDKDLYFGKNLMLSIDLAQGQNLGYVHTVMTDGKVDLSLNARDKSSLNAVLGQDIYFTSGAPGTTTGSPTLSSFRLWVAKPDNEIAKAAIKQLVETSGIDLYVPFVQYNRFTLASAAGSNSVPVLLDASRGRSILRIWSTVCSATETGYGVALNNNATNITNTYLLASQGYRYTYIQSKFNSVPEQDAKLDIASAEDWLVLRDKLEGSVIQNREMHVFNSFWLSDYSSVRSIDFDAVNQTMAGVPLGQSSVSYTIELTTAAAGVSNNVHTWPVFQRQLSIKSGGVVAFV